ERRSNVAETASFGTTGVGTHAYAVPWASPGTPGKLLSAIFKSNPSILIKPTLDGSLWRWLKLMKKECNPERYLINQRHLQQLALYSGEVLDGLNTKHQIEFERTSGHLQLFRSERDIEHAQASIALLAEHGVPHQMLDAAGARAIEPALSNDTSLAGALHLPKGESGNCPLFTKQMKYAAQAMGVEFHFHSSVKQIEQQYGRVALVIDSQQFVADAVVVAAGNDSAALLAPLGLRIPTQTVKGYSATVPIKNFDESPVATITDDFYQVSITRLGNRIRLAGIMEIGYGDLTLRDSALRTLIKIGDDWFPHAANYRNANFWCGLRPTLPDGPPAIGATPIRNVFVNIGHGSTGWAAAAGSGKLVADIISDRQTDIPVNGFALSRFG
ncbi:MAG: D-amino acid dehydrogenase, partial [Paucimonas sp.]|nr:D-amino acid dehydrogenase [Paucimonas sp.]